MRGYTFLQLLRDGCKLLIAKGKIFKSASGFLRCWLRDRRESTHSHIHPRVVPTFTFADSAQDGNLLAAGFVQSQTKMIRGLREADFLSQETRTDQFKISQIEALTGLTFNIPSEADPLHGEANLPMIESVAAQGKPLSDIEEIKLRP